MSLRSAIDPKRPFWEVLHARSSEMFSRRGSQCYVVETKSVSLLYYRVVRVTSVGVSAVLSNNRLERLVPFLISVDEGF